MILNASQPCAWKLSSWSPECRLHLGRLTYGRGYWTRTFRSCNAGYLSEEILALLSVTLINMDGFGAGTRDAAIWGESGLVALWSLHQDAATNHQKTKTL
jgi:hypothetical protein